MDVSRENWMIKWSDWNSKRFHACGVDRTIMISAHENRRSVAIISAYHMGIKKICKLVVQIKQPDMTYHQIFKKENILGDFSEELEKSDLVENSGEEAIIKFIFTC